MTMRGGLLVLGILLLVADGIVAAQRLGIVAGPWGGSGTASVELVLQADGADSGRPRAEMDKALEAAREIIARRVDALDARTASVSRQGANRIRVRVDELAIRRLHAP